MHSDTDIDRQAELTVICGLLARSLTAAQTCDWAHVYEYLTALEKIIRAKTDTGGSVDPHALGLELAPLTEGVTTARATVLVRWAAWCDAIVSDARASAADRTWVGRLRLPVAAWLWRADAQALEQLGDADAKTLMAWAGANSGAIKALIARAQASAQLEGRA